MTNPSLRRSFIALHVTIALVALVQSAGALHHAAGAFVEHHLLAVFGVLQVVGALLFLWPQTLRVGGGALLVVFVHAVLFEIMNGRFPAAHLVYAVATLFVMVHGAAWRERASPLAS